MGEFGSSSKSYEYLWSKQPDQSRLRLQKPVLLHKLMPSSAKQLLWNFSSVTPKMGI
jgi:hypothetical protein